MTTANGNFEPDFELDELVRFNSGELIGERGFVVGIQRDDENGLLYLVEVGSSKYIALESMLDHVDLEDFPEAPEQGMTSQQLSDEVGHWVAYCQSRITGVGNDQYSTETHQKFEAMELTDLIEYSLEELADQVNYATMLGIRLRRIQGALSKFL